MLSADANPAVVEAYLGKEVRLGRVVVITAEEAAGASLHISRFGVVPKSSQPGKWRLIVDLSDPVGSSVNARCRMCQSKNGAEGTGRIVSEVRRGERL